MNTFIRWLINQTELNEVDTRYSVEVNFRTTVDEVLTHYSKVCLGYVSAALKKMDFHIRPVFEEEPYRIMISKRNWDDGEWVCVVSWNPNKKCFIISKGFFNKDRNSVSINSEEDCRLENASEIAKHVRNIMHDLKDKPDRHVEKLKKVPLKRGPK